MAELAVTYKGGMSFEAMAGGHTLAIDLPVEKGGTDSALSPTEVFAASLGACVGVYVVKYCSNAHLDARDMKIKVSWHAAEDRKSLDGIEIVLSLPHADAGKREAALCEVARHCLIHKTIERHPEIRVTFDKG